MSSGKHVSQGSKQFRLHLAWGGSKLVGIMEICEIVMERTGKEEPIIAGLRQVVGGRRCSAAVCMVPCRE